MTDFFCTPVSLPPELLIASAKLAVEIRPANHPGLVDPKLELPPIDSYELAARADNFWGPQGRTLSVQFLDNPNQATRRLILEAANQWNTVARCNIVFKETVGEGEIRVARAERDGYWSYVGPQILTVPRNQPTMNLAGVTERFTDWFIPVHEFGHSAGFQHEQLRRRIVDRIDRPAAYAWFWQTSRWSRQMVNANVLTPIEENELKASTLTDEDSVMCYSLPAAIMLDRIAVRGGQKLSATDIAFAASLYPLPDQPPPPPPPPSGAGQIILDLDNRLASLPQGWRTAAPGATDAAAFNLSSLPELLQKIRELIELLRKK